jgi:hypothetical protein
LLSIAQVILIDALPAMREGGQRGGEEKRGEERGGRWKIKAQLTRPF